jgi:hypothetical protein
MSMLLAGIYDATDQALSVSPDEEVEYEREVTALLPGQWNKFRRECLSARGLLQAHSTNKTTTIRKNVNNIVKTINKLDEIFRGLPEAGVSLFPVETHGHIQELLACILLAKTNATNLPDGRQPFSHRDYLAMALANLMKKSGVEPKLFRDFPEKNWIGDDRYAKLFRIGIILVEGKDPGDLYKHLQAGLEQKKYPL